jgi:septum formation protein
MKKYILASTSPRRRELLKTAGIDFEVQSPDFDENILNKTFSYKLVEDIAENKALSVQKKLNYPAVIISADTVVINNNIVLGKPKDFDDALKMLQALNGKTHKVVTSVCIIDNQNKKKLVKSETSEVTFNNLPITDLKNYINDFKPYDKAGSYGIQELPKNFIKEIKGDYENIVGLPVKLLINMIREITNT